MFFWFSFLLALTYGTFSSNGDSLQQDLNNTSSNPGGISLTSIEVPQNLLDHMVRILSLPETK